MMELSSHIGTREDQKDFKSFLWISFFLHAALVLSVSIRWIFLKEPLVYQSAIRVDIVALPDKTLNPEEITTNVPNPTAKETKTKVEKLADSKAPQVNLEKPKNQEKLKDKQKQILADLKRQKAIEDVKKMLDSQNAARKPEYKGNILSPGTELTGLDKFNFDNYLALIDKAIKGNWFLPEWLNNQGLRATFNLTLSPDGNIKAIEIKRSSGNATYDEYAEQAILNAAPFNPPPEKLSSILEYDGVVLNFP